MRLAVTALLFLFCISYKADCATIYIDNETGNSHFIHLKGEIIKGDYQKIISLMQSSPDSFIEYDWQLDSNGGDVLEAMKIGDLIKELYQRVNVADARNKSAICASACFFIYVSAVSRNAQDRSVGIHRPYFPKEYFSNLSPESAQGKYSAMEKSVRDFLTERGVPYAIIEKMFSLASNEIYWLNGADLANIGDRPAWFDQYLVSKCGFNSRMFIDAINRHDDGHTRRWALCESEILYSQGRIAVQKYAATK